MVAFEVTDRVAPGVVSLPHGWGTIFPALNRRLGVNANFVVDGAEVDLPSGTSVLNGVPVEICAADQAT